MIKNIGKYRTAIMGVGALWILVLHVWYPCFYDAGETADLIERFVVGSGYVGVDVFMYLSAIGLFYSLEKNSVSTFYKHRIKRILFPVLIISMIFAIAYKWNFATYITNVLGINFFRESIYCFLWFVIAIEIVYLLFPLYYKLFIKIKYKGIFTFITILFYILILVIFKDYIRKDFFVFLNRIPIFLFGVLIGYLNVINKKYKYETVFYVVCVFILLFGCYELHLCNDYNHYILVPYSGYLIPAFCITISIVPILALLLNKTHVLNKIFSFLGKMSLEMYCVQEIINEYLRPVLSPTIKSLLLQNIILFIVIILASYSLYQICTFLNKKILYRL